MADESKFLKYQDKNNDGMPDVCDDDKIIKVSNCPSCKPNPSAVVPKWKKRTVDEPWFNDKYCTFQITVVTMSKTLRSPTPDLTDEEFVEKLFKDNAAAAVQGLLDGFNKEESSDTVNSLINTIDYTKYDLDTRYGSVVKLLYTLPYDVFAPIEEREEDNDIDDEAAGQGVEITYSASAINPKLLKLRKAMYMYSRYYRVFQALEGGSFQFVKSGKTFTKSQFDRYGDLGFFFGSSRMSDLLTDLDNWLNDRGMNIFGVGTGWGWFRERVTRITFYFTPEMKLRKMKVYTSRCTKRPRVYGKKRLKSLNSKAAWKDPTAVGYFTQLNQIDNFLSARVERPWIEFVEKFTFPEVQSSFTIPPPAEAKPQTAMSCIGDALAKEGKQLGMDILDDVFSIGDAIAYQFHRNVCQKTLQDVDDEKNALGLAYKPSKKDPDKQVIDPFKVVDKATGETKNALGMATEQAFQTLYEDDRMFVQLCARMISAALPFPGGGQQMIHDMWRFGFGRMKLCGLLDLMIDALQCLFKGLSLEEALASAIKAALNAMSIENFGDLFIGLPPDKQNELEDLVNKKLENSDIFGEGSNLQRMSDAGQGMDSGAGTLQDKPFYGKISVKKYRPWENEDIINRERSQLKEGNYGTFPRPKNLKGATEQPVKRTLAQQFDVSARAQEELDPNNIMQAYVMALIEVYGDNLLGLTDLLNKYPGAQIIASIIALVDCPRPPMFDPTFFDFLKTLELPFCRNINEIKMFRLENPGTIIPYIMDWPKLLFEAMVLAITTLVIHIIMKILVKICQIIGDAICKALEITGDLALAIPSVIAGKTTFADVIRESICGPEADDNQVNATIIEMFEKLGVGGAALADTQAVANFTGDISNATTRTELMEAFMGNASNDFIDIVYTIMENQYPEFLEGMPTKGHLQDFFSDVGNLFPVDVRAAMNEILDALPDDDELPANPSLCASPEDIEAFQDRRCLLLEGRATPEQCAAMFNNLQNENLEDLEEITTILQGGVAQAIEDAMPPIVSQPGCDDALIPFESEESQAAVGIVLGSGLKQLQMEFAQDMLGKGDFGSGEKGWGMLNMILSDTNGHPFTEHQRKVARNISSVDFIQDSSDLVEEVAEEVGEVLAPFFVPSVVEQQHQYPAYVAEWMWEQMMLTNVEFKTNTDLQKPKNYFKSFDDLGWEGWFWTNINLIALPDYGWNVKLQAQMGPKQLKITKRSRKATPDLVISYENNANGYREHDGEDPSWGYDIELYTPELVAINPSPKQPSLSFQTYDVIDPETGRITTGSAPSPLEMEGAELAQQRVDELLQRIEALRMMLATHRFRKGDNARITINEYQRFGDDSTQKSREFEFYSVDPTLDDLNTEEYPKFNSSFEYGTEKPPQIILLQEILSKFNDTQIIVSTQNYNAAMSQMFNEIKREIHGEADPLQTKPGPSKPAWLYGALYDDLTMDDTLYVVDKKQTLSPGGTFYGDAEVANYDEGERDGNREIENDDMILGISKMEYEEKYEDSGRPNRVFYLHPDTYGGTYTKPKIYITPVQNKGWRGFVDVIFPELSPCKPSKKNMVEFNDIQDEISRAYTFMPDDQRLREKEYCAVEVPYNRILERSSKSGIQGLVKAACRIWGTTHMIKAMATFSTFAPKFPETCSSLFSAYVAEQMELSFKDPGGAWWEWFLSFKDEEFWYAFLEQSVQTYARLVDDGEITDPPESVLNALYKINDMQERYSFQYDEQLKAARSSGRAEPWPFDTLDSFRYEEKLNAVRATEEHAKLVLKEMISMEMNTIGEIFTQNMKSINMSPTYSDMDYYAMSNLSEGAIGLSLDKVIKEEVVGLETSGSGHYTNGTELALPDGTPYSGFYHIHEDEDGNSIYMVGEAHSDETHSELTVFANKIIVPIGDITPISNGTTTPGGKFFRLEKYISINGERYAPDDAIAILRAGDPSKNVSDVFPGTLEHVHFEPRDANLYDEPASPDSDDTAMGTDTRVVGLKGELGVRYGLKFSVTMGGQSLEACNVEIDVLDLKLNQVPNLEGNSKLLLCLINKLKEHKDFQLIVRYVFPLNKMIATWAIYNDFGFLPSIGQKTVDRGENRSGIPDEKPGVFVKIGDDDELLGYEFTPGWEHKSDRANPAGWPMSWFVNDNPWDDWDKELLRNSRSRIRNLFKRYYHSRDFGHVPDDGGFSPGKILLKNLKAAFALPPLAGQMPWSMKRRIVSNPFNALGQVCKK